MRLAFCYAANDQFWFWVGVELQKHFWLYSSDGGVGLGAKELPVAMVRLICRCVPSSQHNQPLDSPCIASRPERTGLVSESACSGL